MDTTTHPSPPDYATCSLYVLAGAVAPLQPDPGSAAACFLAACRDDVLVAIADRTANLLIEQAQS